LNVVPKLGDLLADPGKADLVPPEAIPAMLANIELLKAMLWLRLTVPNGTSQAKERRNGERLLCAKETAARMGVSLDYVYDHAAELPFSTREGRRRLFSEIGLDRYLQRKTQK